MKTALISTLAGAGLFLLGSSFAIAADADNAVPEKADGKSVRLSIVTASGGG